MPANRRQQTAQSPASTTTHSTAKYINKDGSKFITVPKSNSSADSSETSPVMAQLQTETNGQIPQPNQDANGTATAVNRKKQKRREKARQAEEAARLAASTNRQPMNSSGKIKGEQLPPAEYYEAHNGHYNTPGGEGPYDSDNDSLYANTGSPPNGYTSPQGGSSLKPSKKKGKNKVSTIQPHPPGQISMSQKKIWNTSGPEERESIKEFWLSLGEEERRSLVKVEKDAVLKKMKEQQKHSCSCTVCGRKRVAIEEELEVLYDAYYEELEQYANNQHGDGPLPLATTRRFGPMNNLHPPNRLPPTFNGQQPHKGRIVENFDDEDGDEEYSEDEADDDEYLSDEEPIEEIPRNPHANDFFNFGQSLTVKGKGGILTVADDLLKNDGKKFIEMMEQLAERRMAREEDAKEYSSLYGHPSSNRPLSPHHHNHNHGPPQDEEDYDDDEDGEDSYDSQEDEYDEEDMDTMTEEQRMEEGRRMFQIFAARMFEQRVLTAWKEKMAIERRQALLDEEQNEALAKEQQKAKKAEAAQKKKEKAQQKKAAAAEEKRKKDEAKAAEEAKLREAEEAKAEQTRVKAEERRKKREAMKKAEEEERVKKEAEKQRRLQEQRDRQAEQERKARDAKERERKEKEDQRQKEKEAKEAKDKDARERREKQERDKQEADAKTKAEKEVKGLPRREDHAAHQLAAIPQTALPTKRSQVPIPMPVMQTAPASVTPHVPVATPVIPKAPTPSRSAATSQKDTSSVPQTPQVGKSMSTSPNLSMPLKTSPETSVSGTRPSSQHTFLHHPQATSPIHSTLKGLPGAFQPSPFVGLPMNMNFAPGISMAPPGFGGRLHHENMFQHQQPLVNQFRPMSGPNGLPMPPGMTGIPMPQGRGFPQHAPPGFPQVLQNAANGAMSGMSQTYAAQKDGVPTQSHSRQQSASYDKSVFEGGLPITQPIARPIARPSSVVQGLRSSENDMRSLTSRLGGVELQGSAALLDDSDEPLNTSNSNPGAGGRRTSGVPGMGRQPYQQMPHIPPGMDSYGFNNGHSSYNTWGPPPPHPFTTSSLPHMGGWGAQPQSTFNAAPGRPSQPRNAAVRQMLCDASKALAPTSSDGWINIDAIQKEIEKLNGHRDEVISTRELLTLCDTEGSQMNGGGSFEVRESGSDYLICFRPDPQHSNHRAVGAPGEIGSPIAGHGPMSRNFGAPGLGIGGF